MIFRISGEIDVGSKRLAYLLLRNHFALLAADEESHEDIEVMIDEDENEDIEVMIDEDENEDVDDDWSGTDGLDDEE